MPKFLSLNSQGVLIKKFAFFSFSMAENVEDRAACLTQKSCIYADAYKPCHMRKCGCSNFLDVALCNLREGMRIK